MTRDVPATLVEGDALFAPTTDGRLIATQWSRGPWDPAHCHGAPPSALLVRSIEQHDGQAWNLARITIELQRPIPVDIPLAIETTTERSGSRISIVGATMSVDDTVVARARALRIRIDDSHQPDVPSQIDPMPMAASESTPMVPTFITDDVAYATDSCEFRFARGSWSERGSSDVWIRLRVPVVPGELPTGAQRAAAAADFGNGVSAGLEHLDWLYINPDLTIHLGREPIGEWIGLAARSEYGTSGAGIACSHLHDADGPLGMSAQSLLVEPR